MILAQYFSTLVRSEHFALGLYFGLANAFGAETAAFGLMSTRSTLT